MAEITAAGALKKMRVALSSPVEYQLPVGDSLIALNPLLGKKMSMRYIGKINCSHCGRKTNKSFSQGYCYSCFKKLAQCDICIMSPEKCHFSQGTCREPQWAEDHCMQDHYVYLANSSGTKVGITRGTQIPTRWIDQGAIQAIPIFRVSNRLLSGQVEVIFKEHVADKTNWRKMLKGDVEAVDLAAERDRLFEKCSAAIGKLQSEYGVQSVQTLSDAEELSIDYPVREFPEKISSLNFDKQPLLEGLLLGIKGQYLILDTGVINIRKFSSYQIEFAA